MKIRDLQKKIADALNGCEELVQGSCKALVEDSMTVALDIQKHLQTVQGVALVVTTPALTRDGACDGISVEAALTVQCVEIPEMNRRQPGHITALDAAEIVAHLLDSHQISFMRMSQSADPLTRSIIVNVDFSLTINLTTK